MRKINPYAKTFYLWNGISAFFFSNCVTPPHSHNTMQLVLGIRKTFKCKGPHTEWKEYNSVVINENAVHQLDTNSGVQLVIYIDASGKTARDIKAAYGDGNDLYSPGIALSDVVLPGEWEKCLVRPDKKAMEELIGRLLNAILEGRKPTVTDPRIGTVLKLLAEDESGRLTIGALAGKACLSESRLRALFKQSTGISLHRYIIWNKIMLALNQILNGTTITEAAFAADFSDASHFHKMLVRMFGISPSRFLNENNKSRDLLFTRYPLLLKSKLH